MIRKPTDDDFREGDAVKALRETRVFCGEDRQELGRILRTYQIRVLRSLDSGAGA